MRSFKVLTGDSGGYREIDSTAGRAKIEGSKEVSGGTDTATYDSKKPNGAPHVDEAVYFNFNHSAVPLLANTFKGGPERIR